MADDQHLNSVRIMQLEERLEELNSRVGNLVDQVAALNKRVAALESSSEANAPGQADITIPFGLDPALVGELSPGMAQVVELIQQGRGEEAQIALYSLPENELSDQPVAVALVASALFIQRGDLEGGLKALRQASQLVDDPRLAAVVQKLETQL